MLGPRLIEAVAAVHARVVGSRPLRIEALMGSHVDALKLVSSLTLFRHVARTLEPGEPRPPWPELVAQADAILAAAAAQGLPPCRFTEDHCRSGRARWAARPPQPPDLPA